MLWIDPSFRYELNAGGRGTRAAGTGPNGWDIVIADSKNNQLYVNSPTPTATGGAAAAYTATKNFDFFHRDGGQIYQGLVAEERVYTDAADFGGDFAALYNSLWTKWFAGNTVNLSVNAATGMEAGTTAITVTATAASAVNGDQTVSLAVTGAGITMSDYALSNSTITIPSGQTSGAVTFPVKDDLLNEGVETATLTISDPSSELAVGANVNLTPGRYRNRDAQDE